MNKLIKIIFITIAAFPAIALADYSVIVSANNANELDKEEISRIYMLRESRFNSGHTISVYTLSDNHELRNKFDTEILGRDPSQMNAHWSRLSFSGRGTAPSTVSNYDEMLSKVANDQSAIGYVPNSVVDGSVKVIFEF